MQAESPAKGVQPLNQLSDHDLIVAFKEGSREAMEEIVGRYEASIFNFGRKMCGNTHDAEDITQDTFLNAFRYLEDFREETKLKNWLFKIASSVCLKKRRKKKYQPDREISLESLMEGGGPHQHGDIPDWSSLRWIPCCGQSSDRRLRTPSRPFPPTIALFSISGTWWGLIQWRRLKSSGYPHKR